MSAETLKVSCVLEGDNAIDFERLSMVFKTQSRAPNRPKQQALMVSASLLALDAVLRKFAEEKGKRYPSLAEVLEFAGCRRADVEKLLNGETAPESMPLDALRGAIRSQADTGKAKS
ncbi:hypothetical protein M4D49_27120 [Cupriavidus pauculus]|uniref:hypothetical protein n=1 Tax=Burkholderiaceae TaxID=119060 RepID=UPI0007C64EE2|nr:MULTISPECIES: hypothetical protein [Burkholderiaceae]MCM3609160.1 hypothetical protein [Cupriavidus pauculus]